MNLYIDGCPLPISYRQRKSQTHQRRVTMEEIEEGWDEYGSRVCLFYVSVS